MQTLYEKNLPFIKQVVKPFTPYEPMEDLLQEAYFGLQEAVTHYMAEKNVLFITYAKYWIKRSVMVYIEKCGSVIRIPSHIRQEIKRYKKCVEKLSQEYGRIPTDAEIIEEMDIDISLLYDIKVYLHGVSSIDIPLNNETEDTIGNTIKDDFCLENEIIDNIYANYSESELWAIIERYISKKENIVIRSRYKANDTLQKIADRYNVTRERIRQIEASALRKLGRGKAKSELIDKFDIVGSGIYKNGVGKYKDRNFTSTVELIAMRRAELREEYEKRLKKLEQLRTKYQKCI